jgi:hypothetical protein
MESERSLPCPQEPSTGSYLEPDQSSPYHPILSLQDHFNINHSPTSYSSKWSLSFWLSHQYPICIPILPIRATYHANLSLLHFIILSILREEYKLRSSSLCSFLQRVTSSLLSLYSTLNGRDKVSYPHRTTGKIIILCLPDFTFLNSRREDERFWTEW